MTDLVAAFTPKAPPRGSRLVWAVVTQTSPLRVRVAGETDPLNITPTTLVADLDVNDVVRMEISPVGQAVIIGRQGGQAIHPNLLVNGGFRVNQRGATSGASVTAGAYFLDRWRAGTTGSFTWSDSGGVRTVTIPSGATLETELEATDFPADTYTLSWPGTSQAALYNSNDSEPTLATSPVTVALDGTNDVTAVFGPGTVVGKVKLERGAVATPFTPRPLGEELALCQRYYQRFQAGSTTDRFGLGYAFSTTGARVVVPLLTRMRIGAPTLTFNSLRLTDAVNLHTVSDLTLGSGSGSNAHQVRATSTGLTQFRPYDLLANSTDSYIAFDAEL